MQKLYKRVDIYYLNFHSHIEQLNSSWMDHLENWSDKTYCCSFSDMGGILICMSKIFHLPMLFHFWSMSQSRYHKADVRNMLFHWTNLNFHSHIEPEIFSCIHVFNQWPLIIALLWRFQNEFALKTWVNWQKIRFFLK